MMKDILVGKDRFKHLSEFCCLFYVTNVISYPNVLEVHFKKPE